MKKITLILLTIFAVIITMPAQEKGIIEEVLHNSVEQKVDKMQKLIDFDDEKALQLKEMELKYLLDVQKAETCFLCNTSRRVKKLKAIRVENLQKILDRNQYLKYLSIENDLLNENNRLILH